MALALLSLDAALTLLPILAVIFVTGLASGFERPALTAFEAQVIPLEQAVQGVSYQSSVSLTGSILGPVVGGIAVAIIGIAGTYGLIAGLLAISTICLFVIPRKPMPEPVPGRVDDRRASRRGRATSRERRRSSARWRSTCSRSSSAAPSRCCRSSRPTSCTSGRSGSASCARRRRSVRSA